MSQISECGVVWMMRMCLNGLGWDVMPSILSIGSAWVVRLIEVGMP